MGGPGTDDERQRTLETVAVLTAACIVFGLIFELRSFAFAALTLLVIGLFFKRLAAKLSRAWLGLAAALGAINSKALLTLVYYLVLTPLACVYRITHGDFLHLKPGRWRQSYWNELDREFEARDLERPW